MAKTLKDRYYSDMRKAQAQAVKYASTGVYVYIYGTGAGYCVTTTPPPHIQRHYRIAPYHSIGVGYGGPGLDDLPVKCRACADAPECRTDAECVHREEVS